MSAPVRRCRGVPIALVAALASTTRLSGASPEAEDHLRQGVALRMAGKNGEALAEFQAAYALDPTPRAQAQIGLDLQALGDWLGAEQSLAAALRFPDDPWIVQYREALDGALATIRAHLAWLRVDVNVKDARFFLNGLIATSFPASAPVRVTAGLVDMEVRAAGYETARRTVDVTAGADVHVVMTLEALPPAPAPPPVSDTPPPSSSSPPLEVRATEVRATPVRRPLTGFLLLGATGAFALGGIIAWRVREDDVAHYNDNSRCRVGTATRAEQCGGVADASNVALGVEIGAFVASAASAATSAWFLSRPLRSAPITARVAWGGAGRLWLACEGAF